MPKHTKKRSTIKRKHRRMKQHAEANKAKAQDNKQLAKEYGPYSHDDYMKFSDINVMPHTDKVKEEFNVSNWSEKAIEHVESDEVAYIPALPMHRKHIITLGDGDDD